MKPTDKPQERIDLSDLYPELTPEQRAEAEYYLARYIDVVRRIYERANGLTGSDEIASL